MNSGPYWLTLAHSPDPDDVFMWWPLGSRDVKPVFDTGPFRFEPIPEDIQVLNRRAIEVGDLDITAISIHAYTKVHRRYRLTDCAGSFGEDYGPKVVVTKSGAAPSAADHASVVEWLRMPGRRIAVPGLNTTAYLTLSLLLGAKADTIVVPFHEVMGVVAAGRADAGLLIHDAQLTYGELGLREIIDLGRWWKSETGLPLPLGGNVVRRDLDQRFGVGSMDQVGHLLRRSIEYALDHWQEGIERIRPMTVGLDQPTLEKYLRMYVSRLTVDAGPEGRHAIELILRKGHEAGHCDDPGKIDFLLCAESSSNPLNMQKGPATEHRA